MSISEVPTTVPSGAALAALRVNYRTSHQIRMQADRLLYVACTRARDNLLVTGVAPASEFLDDLKG